MEHLPVEKCGIPLWIYFFVTVLNRLDNATSKNRMNRRLDKTIRCVELSCTVHVEKRVFCEESTLSGETRS